MGLTVNQPLFPHFICDIISSSVSSVVLGKGNENYTSADCSSRCQSVLRLTLPKDSRTKQSPDQNARLPEWCDPAHCRDGQRGEEEDV